MAPARVPRSDARALARLRGDLTEARYSVDGLREEWGVEADEALFRGDRVPARRALARSGSAASVLARLFVLGDDAGRPELDRALPRVGTDGAVELGLVALAGTRVRPLVDLRPYAFVDAAGAGSWWIASDPGELALGGALPPDHVLGVGGASTTLSGLLVDTPVEAVLDLGTGCGIQALHASRFARRVVATDVSARALAYARFTAGLNDVRGIEFRLGDLFEPVAHERFDRVLSNPPFVITPRAPGVPRYEYRDGGREGDALLAVVVAGLAEHLAPGGVAQLLGNWEYRDGVDGLERALGWADAAGLDAWIVERDVLDPARYAETWIRDGGTRPGTAEFERLTAAWLDDFERRGVRAVGFGYLTLRAAGRGGPTVRRGERLASARSGEGLGAVVARTIAALDLLAGLDDDALAARTLRVAPDVTEERSYWPGEEHPSAIVLRQGGGFAREHRVDAALAGLVGACDGTLGVGTILSALAEVLDASADELRAALLPRVRELVAEGFLLLE